MIPSRDRHRPLPSIHQILSTLYVPLLLLLLLPGCRKSPDPSAGTLTQTLIVSQRNEPATLDPHLATLPDEFFIIRALSEGLVTPDPAGSEPLPALAESWTTSADGLTWTFRLRPAARWSNGDPITASDFVWSYRRALTPSFAAPKAQMFFPVKNAAAFNRGDLDDFSAVGFTASDHHTLVVTLEAPTADLLALAASGTWIPVHPTSVGQASSANPRDASWTRPGAFVGSGAFTLGEWKPNQHLLVQKNPLYWDAPAIRLESIRFLAFDNGDAEERAFRAGQLHVTMSAPASKLASYRAAHPPVLRTVPLHETRYLALNLSRPPLDRPEVRRALALALDRSVLTDSLLQGGQRPAMGFIPPGLGGYQPRDQLAPDPAEARRLLAAAGYPDGRGFPRLEFSAWGVTAVILEAIQQQWQQHLGIEVAIVQREARTHLAALAAGEYEIGFITAIPDYDSARDLFADLMTGGAGNYPRWSSAAYDRLVREAQATPDASARLAKYQEAEALLLADLPLIPLYFNSQNYLIRPEVQGWHADALWTRFYKHVHLHEK